MLNQLILDWAQVLVFDQTLPTVQFNVHPGVDTHALN